MSGKRKPIAIGAKYGMLTILEETTDHICPSGAKQRRVICLCDCGKKTTPMLKNIIKGDTTSCGCASINMLIKMSTTHGMSDIPEFGIWQQIRKRCNKKFCKEYHNYGGRGINVCDEWNNSFECFFNDMGTRPTINHSIERINNDLGYNKENCKWATKKEQANNRRTNVIIDFNGLSMNVTEWAEHLGIDRQIIFNRLHNGWDIKRILTTPIHKKSTRTDRCNEIYEFNNEKMIAQEWAKKANVKPSVFYKRLGRGWSIEDALK